MMSDSVMTPIMRNPSLVAYHDDGTSCTTSRIKWELDCLLEEAILRVEQTFGCVPLIDTDRFDNICASPSNSNNNNLVRRSKPRSKITKQQQVRQKELQTELEQVQQKQVQLLQKKEHRQQHKDLQRVRQRQMQLHQQKTLQRQQKVRQQEQRRIRQLHSRIEPKVPLD